MTGCSFPKFLRRSTEHTNPFLPAVILIREKSFGFVFFGDRQRVRRRNRFDGGRLQRGTLRAYTPSFLVMFCTITEDFIPGCCLWPYVSHFTCSLPNFMLPAVLTVRARSLSC